MFGLEKEQHCGIDRVDPAWTHLKASGLMGDSRIKTTTSRGSSRKQPRENSVTWNTFPLYVLHGGTHTHTHTVSAA